MTYFLSGGSKSGKSMLAQKIAKALPAPHYYLATLRPTDAEDRAIVARHLQERDGWGFETIECESGILSALTLAPQNGTFLLDSVFTLVVVVPLSYVLCNWTDMNVCLVYGLVEAANILKFCIALPILISGSWAHNVISR